MPSLPEGWRIERVEFGEHTVRFHVIDDEEREVACPTAVLGSRTPWMVEDDCGDGEWAGRWTPGEARARAVALLMAAEEVESRAAGGEQ